jgi:DNA-binding MarR family transcriptional regulator
MGRIDEPYRAVEHEIAMLFRRARARSSVLAREVHPELDADAYGLLLRIELAGPARLTDLAEFFGIGKGTMSRQLRQLEELGLVSRTTDPEDRRAAHMALTDEGRRRFALARAGRLQRLRSQLQTWDPADIERLAHLLHRLNESSD